MNLSNNCKIGGSSGIKFDLLFLFVNYNDFIYCTPYSSKHMHVFTSFALPFKDNVSL
jgi:hypothetical protein